MKNIKDYLYLYKDVYVQVKKKNDREYHIGRVCEITSKSNHGDWVKVWFDDVITTTSNTFQESTSNCHFFFFQEDYIKPYLFPLDGISKEDIAELLDIDTNAVIIQGNFCNPFFQIEYVDDYGENTFEHRYITQLSPEQVVYLLSKHFDLFNLIPEGVAIDKTTLKLPK